MYGKFRILIPNEQGVLIQHGLGYTLNQPNFQLGHIWKHMDHGMMCEEESDVPLNPHIAVTQTDGVQLVLRDWLPQYEHVRALLTDEQFPGA